MLQNMLPGTALPELFNVWAQDIDNNEIKPRPHNRYFNTFVLEELVEFDALLVKHLDFYRDVRGSASSVKIFLPHILHHALPKSDEVRVLRLRRDRVDQAFISLTLASKFNEYNRPLSEKDLFDFTILRPVYNQFCYRCIAGENVADFTLKDFESETVYYEDLVSRKVSQVFGDTELKHPDTPIVVDQHSHSHRHYSRVKNLEEVHSWFQEDMSIWKRLGYFRRGEEDE